MRAFHSKTYKSGKIKLSAIITSIYLALNTFKFYNSADFWKMCCSVEGHIQRAERHSRDQILNRIPVTQVVVVDFKEVTSGKQRVIAKEIVDPEEKNIMFRKFKKYPVRNCSLSLFKKRKGSNEKEEKK